ncbi:MAG: peptidylprolyl isomerase, partial [Alphaproteobacteria bacterium]
MDGRRRIIPVILAGLAGMMMTIGFALPTPSVAEETAASRFDPARWRAVDPENLLLMDLANGRVAIELVPAFAPRSVAQIKRLVRSGFYDGLS